MQPLSRVFQSLPENEFRELEAALDLGTKEIPKGGVLLCPKKPQKYVFFLCAGKSHAIRYAPDGREVDYKNFQSGDLLTEASELFGCSKNEYVIFADTPCTVLYFSCEKLWELPQASSKRIAMALFEALAIQYSALQQRLRCLTCVSLREKILAYLIKFETEDEWFEAPFDRNALAAYLFCDRTALCRELSRMKKDGIIDFYKSNFRILRTGFPKND